MKKQFLISEESELPWLIPLIRGQFPDIRVFLLYGSIGAGKTRFVQAFCRQLGVSDAVTSPTFSLINEYNSSSGNVFHIDLYRLNTLEEILAIGIENYLYEENYCFIEWPSLIEPIVPDSHVKLEFQIIDKSRRKILILFP